MRLFLASSELRFPSPGGDPAQALARLVGSPVRTAVVLNALDQVPDLSRASRLDDERRDLAAVAGDVVELDLRKYDAARPEALRDALRDVGLVWAVGGDALALRAAMERSGLDRLLVHRTGEDSIVYGGFSAGACVAGPTLCEADLSRRPFAGREPLWGGMGLVSFTIVPHYRAGTPEDDGFEQIVAALGRGGVPYHALRNGQAIVVDGTSTSLIG